MSIRQKALRGVVWSSAQNWGSSLISTLVFFVLAHRLSKDAFGVVALAAACIGFMEIFLRQGFAHALIQRQDLKPGHLDTAFWANLVLGVGMLGAGLASASTLAWVFDTPTLAPVIRWLSLGFVIGAAGSTQAAILRRDLAFKVLAIRTLLATTVGGTVGVMMALLDYGVWSLVGQVLATRSVAALVMWIGSSWRPGFAVSRARFRELFSFGAFVMGIEFLTFTSARIDILVMGRFLTIAEVGAYDVAFRLLRLITQLLMQTTSAVALPAFSRIQHDRVQMRNAYSTATKMASLLAFPVFVGMGVLAPDLVAAFFGDQWELSITPMRVLSIVGLLYAVFHCNGPLILACGKPAWWLYLAGAQALAQFVAVAIAIRWGITAIAVAFTVRTYALAPLSLGIIRRLLGVPCRSLLGSYVAPLLAAITMGAIVHVARTALLGVVGLYVRTSLCIFVGMVAYALIIRVYDPAAVSRAVGLARLALSGARRHTTKEPPVDHG